MPDHLAAGFDGFAELVQSLWPTYRTNIQPMWNTVLHRYSVTQLGEVLAKHRADHPDETKPIWKTIYAVLAGGARAGKSDLQLVLNQWRKLLREAKRKGSENWSDYEVFQCFLDAQTYPILYNTLTREPENSPDGRLVRMAAQLRGSLACRYIEDLRERGDVIPEWLTG